MRTRPAAVVVAVAAPLMLTLGCTDDPLPSAPAPATPVATVVYTVTASPAQPLLPLTAGQTYNIARGVNVLGDIVGVSGSTTLWPTGMAIAPSASPPVKVDNGGEAYDVNDVGQVAGLYGLYAALWTKSGGAYVRTDIGAQIAAAFPNVVSSFATAVNASGRVVGVYLQSGPIQRCFLWTPTTSNGSSGSVEDLGDLGGGYCIANDINSGGTVAGASTTDPLNASSGHAFVWSSASGMTDITPSGGISYGSAINDGGQVAGYRDEPGTEHAAVWTPTAAGGWTVSDLGAPAFPGQTGLIISEALDINDAGYVVGFTRGESGGDRAFFWRNGAFTWLPDASTATTSASALTDLVGGQVIVAGGDIIDPSISGARQALRWAVSIPPVALETCIGPTATLIGQMQTAGTLSGGAARSLMAKLDAAARQIDQGNTTPAKNVLDAFINEVNALVASGRLTAAQAQPLIDGARCAIAAL